MEISNRTVWVGGLPDGVDDATFKSLFEQYGTITWSKVWTHKWYGLIELATEDDAATFIEVLDGSDCGGRTLKVNRHQKNQNKESTGKGKSMWPAAAGKGKGKATWQAAAGKGKAMWPAVVGDASGNAGGKV